MNERLKIFRKSIQPKMSQEKFGEMLGVSRDVINNFENGRVELTNAFINLICLKFKVNERWLRTGEGEMFTQPSNDLLNEVVKEYDLNTPLQKKAMELFLKAAPADRQATLEAIRRFSRSLEDENSIYNLSSKPPSDLEEIIKKYLMLSEAAQTEVKNFIDYKYEQELGLGEESSDAATEA